MSAITSRLSPIYSCETGALLFAVLNLILWTPGIIKGVYTFVSSYATGYVMRFWDYIDLVVVTEGSLLLLVFTAMLLYGILKKRSGYIQAYLVMGVSVLCFNGFIFLAYIPIAINMPFEQFPDFWTRDPSLLALIVMGQVVYGLILTMIYNVYMKIKAAQYLNNQVTNISQGLKLFSSCSSETGTVVFASLNLMVSVIGVFGGFVAFVTCYWTDNREHNLMLTVCTEISLFLMVFAVFLLHGVLKKQSQHIKIYLTIGTIMLCLTNIGSLVLVPVGLYFNESYGLVSPEISGLLALVIVVQVVYALILAMIQSTYEKIKATTMDQNEQKIFLVQNMDDNLSTAVHKLLY